LLIDVNTLALSNSFLALFTRCLPMSCVTCYGKISAMLFPIPIPNLIDLIVFSGIAARLFMIIVFKAVSINYKFSSRLFSNICRNIRKHFLVHRIVQNLVPMKTEHAGTTSQNFMAFEHLFLRFLDCFELVIFPVVLVLLDKPVTLSGLNCLVVGRKIFIDH
jgi:hypothetical protein